MKLKFTILFGLVIAVLSLIPGNSLPKSDIEYFDLFIHVCMYFVLAGIALIECTKQYPQSRKRFIVMLIVLSTISYGGLLELIQQYHIPDRFGSVSDFLANGLGSVLGLWVGQRFLVWSSREIADNVG